jgi:DNA-directed RNA polymerase
MHDTTAVQIAREKAASAEATSEHIKGLREAIAAGRLDDIPAAGRIIARLYEDVYQRLEVIVNTTARGPGAALRGWLRKVPLDTLTVLSMRTVLTTALRDSAESPATVQRIGHALGRAIEQEALIQDTYKVNPVYVDKTWEYLKEAGTKSPGHIRKTMQAVVRNVLGGVFDGYLTNAEYIHLGKHGLQACLEAGLVELQRGGTGTHTNVVYRVPTSIYDIFGQVPVAGLSGVAQGMVAPPEPWEGASGGGYYTDRQKVAYPLRRIGRGTRQHLRHVLRQNIAECTPVLDTANYLQSQAFECHAPTVELVRRVWEGGGGVLGVPRREPLPQPSFPFPEPWDKAGASQADLDVFYAWKRKVHGWHVQRRDLRAAQLAIGQALRAVRDGEGHAMWFAAFIDSRSRYYYRGTMTPQGSDIAKGVLHFHEKRALGSRGLFWLKVHIANCFGKDKARFEQRAAWVDANLDDLLAGLDAPEDSELYRNNKDAPIGAYSAMWELRAALQSPNPAEYKTGIPVHMDATCSGLQHFSALLRDPIGGMYVNLFDSGLDEKADIYRKVAEMAKARVLRDAANLGHKHNAIARLWTTLEIPRDLAKKPVMTYVYGATMRGVAEFVADYLDDNQIPLPEGVRAYEVAAYMARTLFDAIEDTVPAAAACMRWLRKRAAEAGDMPMLWRSPTGLLVEHDYRDHEDRRVRIRSCGMEYIVVREQLDCTKAQRMQNAISPNFVHALDAAHLTFTALRMRDSGLAMVAIHDSFGCHPCDVDTMHTCIRAAFVELYTEHDPIDLLLKGIGQQEVSPPPQGNLDLTRFMSSEFGFC